MNEYLGAGRSDLFVVILRPGVLDRDWLRARGYSSLYRLAKDFPLHFTAVYHMARDRQVTSTAFLAAALAIFASTDRFEDLFQVVDTSTGRPITVTPDNWDQEQP